MDDLHDLIEALALLQLLRKAQEDSGEAREALQKASQGAGKGWDLRVLLGVPSAISGLAKMAIADNKPGEEMEGALPRALIGQLGQNNTGGPVTRIPRVFDYNHLLSREAQGAGYKMHLVQNGDGLHAKLSLDGKYVGGVTAHRMGNQLGIERAEVNEGHRANPTEAGPRLRLGTSAMEALMTHAYHHLGARFIYGATHSSSAHRVHQKLSRKHKLGYRAKELYGDVPESLKPYHTPGVFDDKYGPYRYKLK